MGPIAYASSGTGGWSVADREQMVLVVDDEAEIVEIMRDYLEADGFRVRTATDGASALALLAEEAIDCLLLDVMMPGASGFDVCRQIRAGSDVPVLFLSARENIELALSLRGWAPADAAERAASALWQVGLAERARQRVSRLSAGERQRVALARALACAEGLLIVDEPTSRLDEAMTESITELLSSAARDQGQTVVCASHDDLVSARADAVLEL